MLRLLADGDFNFDIVRGLLRRSPQFDIVRVHELSAISLLKEHAVIPADVMRRMVLRSTPIRRSISRWPRPWRSSVSTVIRRCGLKTFTPRPRSKGGSVTSRRRSALGADRRPFNLRVEEFQPAWHGGSWAAASERRFASMLGNVEMVSIMLNTNATITYCNDYLLRLTGWRREDVLGSNWFELFIPPGQDDVKGVFSLLLADLPASWHHENEILTRWGELRLIRWSNSVLRSGVGDVIGTASIGEDTTEQKRAQIGIQRLNRVYAVLSGINTLILHVHDRDELFKEACRFRSMESLSRRPFVTSAKWNRRSVVRSATRLLPRRCNREIREEQCRIGPHRRPAARRDAVAMTRHD